MIFVDTQRVSRFFVFQWISNDLYDCRSLGRASGAFTRLLLWHILCGLMFNCRHVRFMPFPALSAGHCPWHDLLPGRYQPKQSSRIYIHSFPGPRAERPHVTKARAGTEGGPECGARSQEGDRSAPDFWRGGRARGGGTKVCCLLWWVCLCQSFLLLFSWWF